MERRTFLAGGAAAVVGISSQPVAAHVPPGASPPLAPSDREGAVARLRGQFLGDFDPGRSEGVLFEHAENDGEPDGNQNIAGDHRS